ncbi:hypothetical protein V5O48_000983 [Marasmius crinis-equi]|uniref:FAD/NAD(P)-binding domain-containing protein n=1 Tax=Marasmius crinis-equi TaxID=585013 RepID=A0ABR3FZY7_9AGAR
MSISPLDAVVVNWLDDFGAHLASGNVDGVVSCFRDDGWLRDILIFTWDSRSLRGAAKITAYLRDSLKPNAFSNFRVDDRPFLAPEKGTFTPHLSGVASGFTFDTPSAHGRGHVRLVEGESGEWKALTVFMCMEDLKGHEERGYENGMWGAHTLAWGDVKSERAKTVEKDPYVLIVGGGQTGLMVAARFRQMQIPTLLIEKHARIGDNWRERYPTLSLHTIKNHHAMLYQPFPENWPLYTPRDKLANWLEQYAESQDLLYWTNSTPLPTPTYDFVTKKWTVDIKRNGEIVTVHPAHIVLATGTLGAPRVPSVISTGNHGFSGTVLHAINYQGGKNFAGKRVVVIGAGNTAADICQDLSFNGAEVTMVQRSTTCVISVQNTSANQWRVWPKEVPTNLADFKFASMPLLLLKEVLAEIAPTGWQATDKEMIEGLRKRGLDVNLGPDGTGNLFLALGRLAGYWQDVGCAQLIIDGKVRVKQGVEVERMVEEKIIFTDGSITPADAVIFATGYENMRDVMKELFGPETINMTGEVAGLDDEGEHRGSYRPTGHPGLWYAAGDFFAARFSSKPLPTSTFKLTLMPVALNGAQLVVEREGTVYYLHSSESDYPHHHAQIVRALGGKVYEALIGVLGQKPNRPIALKVATGREEVRYLCHEAEIYRTALRDLQGKVVPRYYGLYKTTADERAVMVLELCANTDEMMKMEQMPLVEYTWVLFVPLVIP